MSKIAMLRQQAHFPSLSLGELSVGVRKRSCDLDRIVAAGSRLFDREAQFCDVVTHPRGAAIDPQRSGLRPAEMLAGKVWSCGRLHIRQRARLGLL